ncbi:MAG: deoxynucleoside kinase [Candidatus Gracilibacteria bacterium]|nr:deoxynucleoside kinase [Candidatus Gracilibacteria bacterium]
MFIVIDGIDGSGKATQVEIIKNHLTSLGKKVKVLDYPRYGEKSAFMVEKYLNGEYGKDISAKLASIFYAIDRYDSSFELRQNFKNYDFIISNRYVSANMIHQAGKIADKKQTKDFLDWLYDLEYNIFGIPKPDKVIFLNVTPEVSQKLVLKKQEREYLKGGKKMDIHEEDLNHLQNARGKAMEIVDMYDDWVKIDCVSNGEILPIEEITKKILSEML